MIRKIVREELAAAQPIQVSLVKEEVRVTEQAPVVEEVKEEQPVVVEEPVKEEVVLNDHVDFWQIAREVWPQLDNPKPLPKEENKEEPAPAVVAPTEEADEEEEDGDDLNKMNRKPRLPFINRIITADSDIKVNYNEIKNEILSYGLKARMSRTGETFRLKDKKYVKIYLVGKMLKVYLALNPEDYKDSTIPVEDVGHRPAYAEMPLLFKVKSPLSVRRCKQLIAQAMDKDGLVQQEVKDTNWVSELRKINADKAKKK